MKWKREHIIERITDWKFFASVAAVLVAISLVLANVSSLQSAGSAHAQAKATSDAAAATRAQLAVTRDQIRTLRVQRDQANARADSLTTDVKCTQYQLLQGVSLFAGLVYYSKNSTPAQKEQAKPFLTAPIKPAGCS